jgi:predicted TIM-barrel fold metal-dependent hydrolase
MGADMLDKKLLVLLAAAALACAAETWPLDFERIDAHVHIFQPSPDYYRMLDGLKMRVVNICVLDKYAPGFETVAPQQAMARRVFGESKHQAAWCATFDPGDWEKAGFADAAVRSLDQSFRDGAVAVKIYKSMGMELKSRSGAYLMADDPAFAPIYRFIAKSNRTLYAHLAEPTAAWLPLDPKSPHYGYYKNNPDWHMFLHPERPKKETILAARDHILEANPKLRMVGCHLGSMEEDVDIIAKRLDRYPNLAVDTAARVKDLQVQPREKVRTFLIRYQDRVLYATDAGLGPGKDARKAVESMRTIYARDWKYFSSGEWVDTPVGRVQGLALPPSVLRKIFRENALRWVPGADK